jgi:hypothetical protein
MELAAFLPDFPDETLRSRLWRLFGEAEAEAQRFALPDKWITIASVSAGPANSWSDGRIVFRPQEDDLGALFHEIFRSAFQRCRFHDGGGDQRWGGALCDAFRYFMERQLGLAPTSPWFARIDGFCGQTLEAVLAKPGGDDPMWLRKCDYPASLLITRAAKDYDKFRAIWFDLQEQRMQANQALLGWKFGYTVE